MEDLIPVLAKKVSNYFLGDIEILLDQNIIIQWGKLQEITKSIVNSTSLKTKDIINLYYSRYLQTFFAEETPISPEVYNYGITLLADLKNCIEGYSFENCIKRLIEKIGNSIKFSENFDNFLKFAKEIKRIKTELGADNFRDIENDIYLWFKAWIIEKRKDFDIWMLRDCYLIIDSISTDNSIKQKINDLVAVKAYNWFQKTYSEEIQNYLNDNFIYSLERDIRKNLIKDFIHSLDRGIIKTFNWMHSIDCRPDINQKIENLEPLIRTTYSHEKDPSSIYCVSEKSQLEGITRNDYLWISKDKSPKLAVLKRRIRETGEIVVVKSFITNEKENLRKAYNEKQIYEKLSPKSMDFTLKYYGHFTSFKSKKPEYELNLVLECCEKTLSAELCELNSQARVYQNHELAQNIYTLLDLFKKLREEKVNHCDIKPPNIFITADRRFKIGDFDLSEAFTTSEASNMGTRFHKFQGGTENYMAPEVKEHYNEYQANGNSSEEKKYSKERSDVYSLGLVFLIMITLKYVVGLNEQARQSELIQIINGLELDWAKRLLRKMLAYNYKERPRFSEALEMLEEDPEFILCLNSSD